MLNFDYRLKDKIPVPLVNKILDMPIHICIKKHLIYSLDIPEYLKDLIWEKYNGDKP